MSMDDVVDVATLVVAAAAVVGLMVSVWTARASQRTSTEALALAKREQELSAQLLAISERQDAEARTASLVLEWARVTGDRYGHALVVANYGRGAAWGITIRTVPGPAPSTVEWAADPRYHIEYLAAGQRAELIRGVAATPARSLDAWGYVRFSDRLRPEGDQERTQILVRPD